MHDKQPTAIWGGLYAHSGTSERYQITLNNYKFT